MKINGCTIKKVNGIERIYIDDIKLGLEILNKDLVLLIERIKDFYEMEEGLNKELNAYYMTKSYEKVHSWEKIRDEIVIALKCKKYKKDSSILTELSIRARELLGIFSEEWPNNNENCECNKAP